jgi:ligand-binding sensor domain-containing protein
LAEDRDGTLWIGTRDGLVGYRDHHFWRIRTRLPPNQGVVWRLAAHPVRGVWIQADSDVMLCQNGNLSSIWRGTSAASLSIKALQADRNGVLHILLTDRWLTILPNAGVNQAECLAQPNSGPWATGLPSASPGVLWAGSDNGLERIESIEPASRVWVEDFAERLVNHLYEDRSTNLWVNVRPGGLYHCEGSTWTIVDLGGSFTPPSLVCMEGDLEGNLWVGTDDGLIQVQRKTVHTFTHHDGLADNEVWSVCEGEKGTIWLATRRGVNRIDNDTIVPTGRLEAHPEFGVRCVLALGNDQIWIGKSRLGLWKLGAEPVNVPLPNVPLSLTVIALYADRSKQLWVGGPFGVVAIKEDKPVVQYPSSAGQSSMDVKCILED